MKTLHRAGAMALALMILCGLNQAAHAQCVSNPSITGRPCVTLSGTDEWFDFRKAGQAVTAPISNVASAIRQRPLPISRQRIIGGSLVSGVAGQTFIMTTRAPAEFDAVQLVLVAPSADGTNAVKVTVAAPDAYVDGVNGTVAGAAISPTVVTWGTTQFRNPRNPGGGATTTLQSGSGYTGTSPNNIEGLVFSDIISLPSLARTDTVGAPPLLTVRLYAAANAPITGQVSQFATSNANPFNAVAPDSFCGFTSGDQTAATGGITVPTAGSQGYCPSVDVIYYLRGQRIFTIASGGDSLDQGYCVGAAVNCSAGSNDGFSRQFARSVASGSGQPVGYTSWNFQGLYSSQFNERLLNHLMLGDCAAGVTHLFFKPYSTNEGDISQSAINTDLKRADHVLDWAYRCNITPILVYPWAGQGVGRNAMNQVYAYIDRAKARGVPTLDARSLISDDGSTTSNTIKASCLTVNSSGVSADLVHINAACQKAVADLAYAQRANFNLP